jgi:hypothetical protein
MKEYSEMRGVIPIPQNEVSAVEEHTMEDHTL